MQQPLPPMLITLLWYRSCQERVLSWNRDNTIYIAQISYHCICMAKLCVIYWFQCWYRYFINGIMWDFCNDMTDHWYDLLFHYENGPPRPGPRFNIKMTSYQYRKSHCGDKTILRPSYLRNGIYFTGKTTYLYWIRAHWSMLAYTAHCMKQAVDLVVGCAVVAHSDSEFLEDACN